MPITSRPQDKFAFLFSGHTDSRFHSDLVNVFTTLTEFYNYPKAHIWVAFGGPDDLSASFSGANVAIVSTELELSDHFTLFANAVNGNIPEAIFSNPLNTSVIYLTGKATDATSAVNPAKILLKPGTSDVYITSTNLGTIFSLLTSPQNQVNLVMQQDFANSFVTNLYSNGISSLEKTVTNVNGAQTNTGNTTGDSAGGNFTKAWTAGLKMEKVMVGATLKFADELSGTLASEKFLISLEQAKLFADTQSGITYNFQLSGGGLNFLGRPSFLIQDGEPAWWWESPDIFLTHPYSSYPTKENDLYITDAAAATQFNNRINVRVRNIGTHPVRKYRIGIKVYRTPSGGMLDTIEENGKIPLGIILKPTVKTAFNIFRDPYNDKYEWDTPFYEGTTHECLWAKATLPVNDSFTEPFDFSYSVTTKEEEAQRNTDQGSDPPKKEGKNVPGNSFRGNKLHLYNIKNTFKETHRFALCTIPEYHKSLNSVNINWYYEDQVCKRHKLAFEKIEKGYSICSFVLRSGETKVLLGDFGFKPAVKERFARLPVEILVDRKSGSGTRKPIAPSLVEKFAALAGFTIVITNEPANLICKTLDKKGNPVTDAEIIIQTVNNLAGESNRVDKNGELVLKSINPDVYRITAVSRSGKSEEKIVQLSGKETVKVELTIKK